MLLLRKFDSKSRLHNPSTFSPPTFYCCQHISVFKAAKRTPVDFQQNLRWASADASRPTDLALGVTGRNTLRRSDCDESHRITRSPLRFLLSQAIHRHPHASPNIPYGTWKLLLTFLRPEELAMFKPARPIVALFARSRRDLSKSGNLFVDRTCPSRCRL